jgi:hypothetical protein
MQGKGLTHLRLFRKGIKLLQPIIAEIRGKCVNAVADANKGK